MFSISWLFWVMSDMAVLMFLTRDISVASAILIASAEIFLFTRKVQVVKAAAKTTINKLQVLYIELVRIVCCHHWFVLRQS